MYTYSEMCPKCGGLIESITLTSYPPINKKRCTKCGATWEQQINYVISVFNPEEQGYTEVSKISNEVKSDESNTSNY